MPTRPPAPPPVPHRRQRGFTLIEQLAVVALVGTSAATALPALVALTRQAEDTALAILAASAGTAMLLNQAGCLVTDQRAVPGKCQPVRDCSDVSGLLQTDLPAGYAVRAQPLPAAGASCSLLRQHDGSSASFHGAATGG